MTGETAQPATVIRRSQIYRWHQRAGAAWEICGDACFVRAYAAEQDEIDHAKKLAICDLSLWPRSGFRGTGAGDWLARHATLPARPNLAFSTAGGLIARLSQDEYLLIDCLLGTAGFVASLDQRFAEDEPARTYALPRADSHSLFAISGADAASLLAKLCAIDLRPDRFEPGAIAQTSVARLDAIVVRTMAQLAPVYYLLADVSAAEYLWHCVLDAMIGSHGCAVGVPAMRFL